MTSGAFQVLNTNVCVCVCTPIDGSPVLVLVLVLVPVVVAFPLVTLRSVSCFTAACSRLNSQHRHRDVNKQENQTNKQTARGTDTLRVIRGTVTELLPVILTK